MLLRDGAAPLTSPVTFQLLSSSSRMGLISRNSSARSCIAVINLLFLYFTAKLRKISDTHKPFPSKTFFHFLSSLPAPSSLGFLPRPPSTFFHISSCVPSTASKPMSRTSVNRRPGHRLTDIGDVGLGGVEGAQRRQWDCPCRGSGRKSIASHRMGVRKQRQSSASAASWAILLTQKVPAARSM